MMRPMLLLLLIAWVTTAAAADLSPLRPDPTLTPGAARPGVTAKQLCPHADTKAVRDVTEATKNQVFAEYGITAPTAGEYEIDHLVSLELGGSNDLKNLWPQSYVTHPLNAHVKDRLEDRLHALVCAGNVSLATAQRAIAIDWIAAYRKYVGATPASVMGSRGAPVLTDSSGYRIYDSRSR